MKVVFDFQTFLDQQYGGVSRYFAELYKCLGKYEDCDISIPILISKNEYMKEYGLRCIPNKRLIFNKYTKNFFYEINKRHLEGYLKRNDVDIVHMTWNDMYIKDKRIKTVVTIHDMIHELVLDEKDRLNSAKEIENKSRAIHESDAIIAISQNTKKDILKVYPEIPEEKITVIYHGVNLLPDPPQGSCFDIPDRYILYVGYRHFYKNAWGMVREIKDLLIEDKTLHLYFAGGRGLTEEENRIIDEYGIRDKVIQKDVPDYELAYLYRNATCFIYPSLYEGFGLPILEAFSKECPVICTNRSSFPEIAGEAALFYDPDIDGDLLAKVRLLLKNNADRDRLIDAGNKRLKMFDYSKTAEATYNLYKNLLENG